MLPKHFYYDKYFVGVGTKKGTLASDAPAGPAPLPYACVSYKIENVFAPQEDQQDRILRPAFILIHQRNLILTLYSFCAMLFAQTKTEFRLPFKDLFKVHDNDEYTYIGGY